MYLPITIITLETIQTRLYWICVECFQVYIMSNMSCFEKHTFYILFLRILVRDLNLL